MTPVARAFAWIFSLVSLGCGLLGGVTVETVDTSVQKPSNVALYVEVTSGGEPLGNLEPKNFKIYENGELLSAKQIGRTLLPTDAVTEKRVVLLVDLSANPNADQRAAYAQAAEAFVRKLAADVPVSVRAYDGGEKLHTIADFPRGSTQMAVPELTRITIGDSSRNLNGAVTLALADLDRKSTSKPVRLGTLVVFARGPDLAGRVTEDAMWEALNESRHEVVGIVIGPDAHQLDFARGGVIRAQDGDSLPIAFEEAGSRVAALYGKYYLVAYCSPARAGQRRVRVEVEYTDLEGNEKGGSTSYDLDATGFGPGCNAETLPRFERPREKPGSGSPGSKGSEPSSDEGEHGVVAPPASGEYAQ
jgi:hypothetical protein